MLSYFVLPWVALLPFPLSVPVTIISYLSLPMQAMLFAAVLWGLYRYFGLWFFPWFKQQRGITVINFPLVYYDLLNWALFPINWLITAVSAMQPGKSAWAMKDDMSRTTRSKRSGSPATGSENDDDMATTERTMQGDTDAARQQRQQWRTKQQQQRDAGTATRRHAGGDADRERIMEQTNQREMDYSPISGSDNTSNSQMQQQQQQQQRQRIDPVMDTNAPQLQQLGQQQFGGMSQQQSDSTNMQQQQQQRIPDDNTKDTTDYLRRWSGTTGRTDATTTDSSSSDNVKPSRASGAARDEDIDINATSGTSTNNAGSNMNDMSGSQTMYSQMTQMSAEDKRNRISQSKDLSTIKQQIMEGVDTVVDEAMLMQLFDLLPKASAADDLAGRTFHAHVVRTSTSLLDIVHNLLGPLARNMGIGWGKRYYSQQIGDPLVLNWRRLVYFPLPVWGNVGLIDMMFRGQLTGTMKYDYQPWKDHFAVLDDGVLLSMWTARDKIGGWVTLRYDPTVPM